MRKRTGPRPAAPAKVHICECAIGKDNDDVVIVDPATNDSSASSMQWMESGDLSFKLTLHARDLACELKRSPRLHPFDLRRGHL